MAFGVPVLSYDMPWLSFMKDGRGIVTVPQKKHELLAEKVVEVLSDRERMKALGLAGKQQITEIAEQDIETDWKCFFDVIGKQQDHDGVKQDYASIVFKYLTLYQFTGKNNAVNREVQKGKRLENSLKKEQVALANAQNKNKTLSSLSLNVVLFMGI